MGRAALIALLVVSGLRAQSPDAPEPIEPAAATAPAAPKPKPDLDPGDLLGRIETLEKAKDSKLPTVNWTGQFQTDAAVFNQDANHLRRFGSTPDGIAFRRARFGMLGDYGPANYRIEFEFAGGRPQFLDVYAGVTDIPYLGYVRVGHYFEPFSLEQVTSERFATFLERSIINQAFAPQRNLGTMVRNAILDDRATYAVGLFATDSDVFGDSVGAPVGIALTGRATGLPWYEPDGTRYLHLGVGYSFRESHNRSVQFRAQPELRIGQTTPTTPFVADTKAIPSDYSQLIGFEWLLMNGPVSVQSEAMLGPVHSPTGGNLLFWGGYAEAAWRITGESRTYRKDNGTVERLIPRRDFVGRDPASFGRGPGAVELAARVSYLDLQDGRVNGGRVTDLTLGVNWHLNPYLRVTGNYIRSWLSAGGISDAVGLRLGWEF